MAHDSNYIKNVEKHFLRLYGKGIMLSSRDYNLIEEWKQRGIPEDIVIKGISMALGTEQPAVRNLYSCKPYVEKLHGDNKSRVRGVRHMGDSGQISHIDRLLKRVDKAIENEKRPNVKEHYMSFRKSIESLYAMDRDQIFGFLQSMEKDFFETFYNSLDEDTKLELINDANSMIPGKAGFLNENVRQDTVIAFRNELIEKRFCLENIFKYD